jgi:GntR family transcriptional repressor for pyruvate dehydrogenase complex
MPDPSSAGIQSRIVGLLLEGGLFPGAPVPPERELAQVLGTSRVTLRQALAALGRSGLLAARRGSGIRLRAPADWSLGALAALLEGAAPGSAGAEALGPWIVEALALRRSFARGLPAQLAGRLATGSLAKARRLAEEAWAARGIPARFVELDARALRAPLEIAGAPAAAWLWNDLNRVPLALAARLAGAPPAAADYVARQAELWDALEAGDAARAERLIGAHLARLDRGLLAHAAGTPYAAGTGSGGTG